MDNSRRRRTAADTGRIRRGSAELSVEAEALWSLLTVETRSCGFFADRRPQLLYERHIFHKRTQGRFDAGSPDISSSQRGGCLGGSAEYTRLAKAMLLDRRAALERPWGLGQVMGFNAVPLQYSDVEDMVARFLESEDAQLEGVRRFIGRNTALSAAFRAKNWVQVAFFYNGSGFAENGYDQKLARFYDLYTTKGPPNMELRAAQVRLWYLGFDPHGIDGVMGRGTQAALLAFQKARGIPQTADLDAATSQEVQTAAGV